MNKMNNRKSKKKLPLILNGLKINVSFVKEIEPFLSV